MSPREVLQFAAAELDRLSQELISCGSNLVPAQKAIDSVTEKLSGLSQEVSALGNEQSLEHLRVVLTKAKRLQALLEAGTSFHCHSIFGKAETPENTYNSDGTFNPNQDFRIVFQG